LNPEAIQDAAHLFIEARRSGQLLADLPVELRPADVTEALAIQDATVNALGETVAGWKVSVASSGQVVRGVLLRSRVFTSPARIPAARVPMQGVEAEVAFRFDRDMPPRQQEYTYAEVAEAVTAIVAIEVVDSRFRSYRDAPPLHRIADCASNGAFVAGTAQPRWREFDLAKLAVVLSIDDETVVRRVGGHPTGDPLLSAVALVKDMRKHDGVRSGQIVTTGTYTGMSYAKPGQAVGVTFEGFGSAEVLFTR
jgi:2-keto-4-pentenoate hydratase